MSDDKVILLSDILPTAWHACELGQVGEGDTVAIWGAGPGERGRPLDHFCDVLVLMLMLCCCCCRC